MEITANQYQSIKASFESIFKDLPSSCYGKEFTVDSFPITFSYKEDVSSHILSVKDKFDMRLTSLSVPIMDPNSYVDAYTMEPKYFFHLKIKNKDVTYFWIQNVLDYLQRYIPFMADNYEELEDLSTKLEQQWVRNSIWSKQPWQVKDYSSLVKETTNEV